MARPTRRDADYFPFYAKDGRTLAILQHKYGLAGIGFFTNVMRMLTVTPNHFVDLNEQADRLYAFSKIGCDPEEGEKMIETMVTTGKINQYLWSVHKVLFSDDLVDSLSELYRKRNTEPPNADDIMQFVMDYREKKNNRRANSITAPVTTSAYGLSAEDSGNNPQSIVKNSKVKKSKERGGEIPSIGELDAFTDYWLDVSEKRGTMAYPVEYEKWWEVYPRKDRKKEAFRAWLYTLRDGEVTHDELLRATIVYAEQMEGREERFIKQPTTFLSRNEPWRTLLEEPRRSENGVLTREERDRILATVMPPATCPTCGASMGGSWYCPICGTGPANNLEIRAEYDKYQRARYGEYE